MRFPWIHHPQGERPYPAVLSNPTSTDQNSLLLTIKPELYLGFLRLKWIGVHLPCLDGQCVINNKNTWKIFVFVTFDPMLKSQTSWGGSQSVIFCVFSLNMEFIAARLENLNWFAFWLCDLGRTYHHITLCAVKKTNSRNLKDLIAVSKESECCTACLLNSTSCTWSSHLWLGHLYN